MIIKAVRMASEAVLQRMKQRADLADRISAELKAKIEQLKVAAAQNGSSTEEDKLRKENEMLKAEIENIKLQLTLAEIMNGVKQVFMPNHGKEPIPTSVKQAGDSGKVQVKQEQKGKPVVENGNSQEAKPAKDSKPKKESKPKASPVEEKMDISRLDLRVGKIVDVKKHPDADTLYIENVDVGEGKNRTVVSGLVKSVTLDEMQDRLAVFMCNLKPAKMRGVLSEGMIMCASSPDKVEILVPPSGVVIGDKVTFKDYTGEPDIQLNPKKKVWETLKPDVRTNEHCVATFRGCPFTVEGKGEVKAPTLSNAQIS